MRPVDQLCEVLHERGLKVTPQRRLIFEVLYGSRQHPSADDIYNIVKEVMPDVSVATVYHTINDLVTMVEQIAGIKLARRYDLSAPKGVGGRNSDNTFIRSVLNWEPDTPLCVGMPRTYAWIQQQYSDRKAGKRVVQD